MQLVMFAMPHCLYFCFAYFQANETGILHSYAAYESTFCLCLEYFLQDECFLNLLHSLRISELWFILVALYEFKYLIFNTLSLLVRYNEGVCPAKYHSEL